MAQMYNRVVSVITRAYDERSDDDLVALLPWFSNKTKLLHSLQIDVLMDILRHCDFQVFNQDDVIIYQGDIGDSFYIILHGSVSIFINTEGPAAVVQQETLVKPDGSVSKKKLDRTRFGKFITSLDAGKSFGEMALLNKDCIRNATIIADEKSDLLVINRQLFGRSLKAAHEQELKQRQDFVNSCPLFEKWQAKYKRQVIMSLRHETLPFDALIVKQGAAVDGLLFILKGQAKVMIDPSMHHAQFEFASALEHDPQDAQPQTDEHSPMDTARKAQVRFTHSAISDVTNANANANASPPKSARTAKSGRRQPSATQRHIYEISLIGPNEIIGDVEQALGLQTYLSTLVSTLPTELFRLDARNYERLVSSRSSDTVAMLRQTAAVRLHAFLVRSLDRFIPFVGYLATRVQRLTEEKHEQPRSAARRDKQLLTFESFIPCRGPVIDFFGPGTVFYRNRRRRQVSLRRAALRHPSPPNASPGQELPDASVGENDKQKEQELERLPTEETRLVCVESSHEHLQQLERRLQEWHSTIHRELTSQTFSLPPTSQPHARRHVQSATTSAWQALQFRRFEPHQLTEVKPGAQVYLLRRARSRASASASASASAPRQNTRYRNPSVKYIDSTGRPVEKELTPNDCEALRSLLRQKAQEMKRS